MANRRDPNDPKYLGDPAHYKFVNGLWQLTANPTGEVEEFWNDPDSDWTRDFGNAGKAVDDVAGALGYAPQHVEPTAPGGLLDTSNADEERARMGVLLGQLQQQAASGDGAWQDQLADATQQANSSAMALGQSQPGVDYQSALSNIGNAQGATAQRAVGQGNILREQSKIDAQDQLAGLLGGMNSGDASQAAAGAAAQQGVTELNATLRKNASGQVTKDSTSFGGLAAGAMSDGGKVPGRAEVFGDDSRNDTVRAMLSPGEIVIPRSHASSPESAADFVRALQQSQGAQHMADGGTAGTGLSGPNGDPSYNSDRAAGAVSIFLPHVGAALRQTPQQAPSIANGGLFDTTDYDQTRDATLANANLLQGRASGNGPSVAPQQMQNATDENIATAMQAGNRGVSAGDVLQRTTAATQGSAGNSAATAAQEQQAGQGALAHALAAQRARDAQFSIAQQQAAFRQTQMNAGIGLEQQAAMRGLLAGAGTAAVAGSSAMRKDGSYDLNDTNTPEFDAGLDTNEFSSYPGQNPADLHDSNDLWTGGVVESLARGGRVGGHDGRRGPARAPRRDSDGVEVTPLEPTRLERVNTDWMGFIGPERPSRLKDGQKYPDEDKDEWAVQYADGGMIPDDNEEQRSRDFLAALRRSAR